VQIVIFPSKKLWVQIVIFPSKKLRVQIVIFPSKKRWGNNLHPQLFRREK
jgi:hypothetical protein